MQGGVLPGEQGGSAGRACGGRGVVAMQLHAPGPEALPSRQLLGAEASHRHVLIGRWVALLVGHDEEDVGRRVGHRGDDTIGSSRSVIV